jgi:hypothetical protein
VPVELQAKIDNSFDLNKLKNFNAKLDSVNIDSTDKIQRKFNEYVKEQIAEEQAFYYSSQNIYTGEAAAEILQRYAPSPYTFLSILGLKNINDLAKEINIPNNYRIFGASYSLPDNIVKDILNEEIKEKLPKFQTGGLLQLQTGGKLAGYGGGDRNLALLEDGEFVIRKEAVRAFGVDLFHKLNNLQLPKFQVGGLVGNLPSVNNSQPADLVNINFTLPNNKSYTLQGSEEIARALASEIKRIM